MGTKRFQTQQATTSQDGNMNQLKLYRYSQEYIKLCEDHGAGDFIKDKKDKIYTCLGEFVHAPGHVLMVEFGNWEVMPGMPEICNFEELKRHPADFAVTIEMDDEEEDV